MMQPLILGLECDSSTSPRTAKTYQRKFTDQNRAPESCLVFDGLEKLRSDPDHMYVCRLANDLTNMKLDKTLIETGNGKDLSQTKLEDTLGVQFIVFKVTG